VTPLQGWGAVAGRVPLWHPVSVHSMAEEATGGTPLTHLGSVQALAGVEGGGGPPLHFGEPLQALAAVAVRLSEPAVRAAEITAAAATRLIWVFSMTASFRFSVSEPTVTCAADVSLKPG